MEFNRKRSFFVWCVLIISSWMHFVQCSSVTNGFKCKEANVSFCCHPRFNSSRTHECEMCPDGYESNDHLTCEECEEPYYGRECLNTCKCSEDEICHHLHGCINNTWTTPNEVPGDNNNNDKKKDDEAYVAKDDKNARKSDDGTYDDDNSTMTISIVIASCSMLLACSILIGRCLSKFLKNESAISAICKNAKHAPHSRCNNIYGTYEKRPGHTRKRDDDDDDYEFDSDPYDDEDPYAVIRDSQMINIEEKDDINKSEAFCQYDKFNNVNYNHLYLMGKPRDPKSSPIKGKGYSRATYGHHKLTFRDEYM